VTTLNDEHTTPSTQADPTGGPGAHPDDRPGKGAGRPRRLRRHRRLMQVVPVALALVVVPTGWSYAGYLRAPGDAPVTVRTSDWMRDHGFESLLNDVEQWWYTRSKPSGSKPPAADIPQALRAAPAAPVDRAVTAAPRPAPGEAVWTDVGGLAARAGSVQQTYLRPDPMAPSVTAELVRFDQHAVRTVLVPGTKEPGGAHWSWGSEIPLAQRPKAVAAFNAGFKFGGTPGGMYAEGRHAVRPLADGLASLVVRSDGTADVAKWGRDARMTKDVASVRQNLHLIVDQGHPVPGLTSERGQRWGTRKSQFQYTWRSAVGVDARGRLVYAAGSQMTLTQLATAMVDAGAVRAMQLDIHDGVVSFNWYRPDPHSTLGVVASKLTPSMQRSPTRYLTPDSRDFVTVEAR
jgi:hypothetical protein